jgi:hypothetical protein
MDQEPVKGARGTRICTASRRLRWEPWELRPPGGGGMAAQEGHGLPKATQRIRRATNSQRRLGGPQGARPPGGSMAGHEVHGLPTTAREPGRHSLPAGNAKTRRSTTSRDGKRSMWLARGEEVGGFRSWECGVGVWWDNQFGATPLKSVIRRHTRARRVWTLVQWSKHRKSEAKR